MYNIYDTLIGGAIGIAGVLLGIFVDRLIRRYGKIHLNFSNWKSKFFGENDGMGNVKEVEIPTRNSRAIFSFYISIFNDKDLSTGLKAISIEFSKGGDVFLTAELEEGTGRALGGQHLYNVVKEINLPSREYVTMQAYVFVDVKHFSDLLQCDQVTFVASTPNGHLYKEIVTRQPIPKDE